MQNHENQRFESLFQETGYQRLKNELYSYLLRKRAVAKCLSIETMGRVLEVGCGISPTTGAVNRIVYSDLSFEAMRLLKHSREKGLYVVADGVKLPFKTNAFSHAICAEVLEHVENDRCMLKELSRILKKPAGCLILTLPHRRAYFANDDAYVHHYRRYEIPEVMRWIRSMHLTPVQIKKVMGPVGKATMSLIAWFYMRLQRQRPGPLSGRVNIEPKFHESLISWFRWLNRCYHYFMWLEARIIPLSMATVVLIQSRINNKDAEPNDN
jgi:SAM-dependent methyltransferase